MKHITILGSATILVVLALTGTSHAGRVKLPYQTEQQLKDKCAAAGGDFLPELGDGKHACFGRKGAVDCNSKTKTCTGTCQACGSKAITKSLPNILGQPKKRPKVLQEGGGGGEPGNVEPTVLGGGNPRATPDGNMPDISGDGSIQ